jgi:hypothetical protein
MASAGAAGLGTGRSPVLEAASPRSPHLQPDVVDIERQPMLEATQLEVSTAD